MRRPLRTTLGVGVSAALATLVTLPAVAASPAPAAATSQAEVQDFLAGQLSKLGSSGTATVLVHGTDLAAAKRAVSTSGLQASTTFDKIGVVVARGTKAQIQEAGAQPGVTYLEGNQPIAFTQTTSNQATRGDEALTTLTGADGSALSGAGVSVGLIDSGVDPTHPYLTEKDGSSVVVSNNKVLCDPFEAACQVVNVPNSVDTDTLSVGGHGTHVAGIIAGRPTTLSDGAKLHGAAPGSKLVSLSTGAALVIVGADSALNWVLEHHAAPCGAGVAAAACPPIKVTNNSYGPSGGGEFDPQSATVKLQRALAAEGVMTVWANGNDGGDGSENLSNPPGQDPTGGIVSVASYNDLGTGTREGEVSDFSSRGKAGQQSSVPGHLRPRRPDHLVVPCLPRHLQHRSRPAERARRDGHRDVQHDQRYVDGGTAHRRHRRPAVPGGPGRDPHPGGELDEDHGAQVHLRCALRVRIAGHHVVRQGLRPRRRGRSGTVARALTRGQDATYGGAGFHGESAPLHAPPRPRHPGWSSSSRPRE